MSRERKKLQKEARQRKLEETREKKLRGGEKKLFVYIDAKGKLS